MHDVGLPEDPAVVAFGCPVAFRDTSALVICCVQAVFHGPLEAFATVEQLRHSSGSTTMMSCWHIRYESSVQLMVAPSYILGHHGQAKLERLGQECVHPFYVNSDSRNDASMRHKGSTKRCTIEICHFGCHSAVIAGNYYELHSLFLANSLVDLPRFVPGYGSLVNQSS